MKFLKNNLCTFLMLTLIFCVAMTGDAEASTVFTTAKNKLTDLFKNVKWVIFIIGGFGLVALAFQAIFGKLKWAWFAALAFGLAVVAAASSIINYANNDDDQTSGFADSLQ
ncbi:MAG: TrbC/VirB2 family protein [Alphaproteobacteria bacterium]|nr:TrbC/VirB2 family protein [Alphaproteobacteria bacterium]